jgi:uncharacterized protein (TIGR02646 family)
MIRVTRIAKPQALQRYADNWLINLQRAVDELQQLENNPRATEQAKRQAKTKVENAQKKYNHLEVKNALVQMFYGKCAYCESQITIVTYGHIEHFYPKHRYIDKTFNWENLLLACDICNDAQHKGTRFPVDSDGQPLLINPTDGIADPAVHLRFDWDVKAGLASIYGRDTRGREVEHTFDLNGLRGRTALVKARSEHVKKLWALLSYYAQTGNREALDILGDACQPSAPYAVFALTYIAPNI